MYNIEPPYHNIWEGMTADQINAIKDKWQKELPAVELMKIKADPDCFMGLERDQKLRLMGCNEQEIEQMTGFRREIPDAVDLDAEVEIHVSGVDLPDQYRAFCAGLEAEKLKQKPILEVERTSDPNLKDILKDGPAKLF
jgi:hypothetical protein